MDKLLCFCHFCELHGPNIILTTNWLSETDLLSYKTWNKSSFESCSSSMSSLPNCSLSYDNLNLFTNEMLVMNDEISVQTNHCEGCSLKSKSSQNGFNAFVSFNKNKKFGFITNSYPIDKNNSLKISNDMIRDACIRSLSCEAYDNGSEGVIYFGDDQRGHILSYLFVLRDSQARGFQRTYSILVISRNKHQLLSDWDFYVKHIEQIVVKLKNKAKIIYESELTQITCQQRRSLILDNASNIGSNLTSFEDLMDRNPLNTHRANSRARSLLELTGDNSTFANLHIQFSWLLYAVHNLYESDSIIGLNSCSASVPTLDQNLSLRSFYRFIGKEKFQIISYNTVIGNKIIVCDSNNSRLKSFIHCLSQLLPEECIIVKTNCDYLDESSKHNLIGISSVELLPPNVMDSQFHILITLKDKQINRQPLNNLLSDVLEIGLHSNVKLPDRMPNYLINLERILTDVSYSDSTFDSYLISLKHEWLNKSQAFYSYTKGVNPPRTTSQINSFLKLIQTEECDSKLIMFWSNSGLSVEFKTKVFSINSETNLLNEFEIISV